MYFTLSAAQMIVYNAKVQEENYFYWFARKFGGTPPEQDQKYSHLINIPGTKEKYLPWLEPVPSQIFRNGAVLYAQAHSRFKQGLANRPVQKQIKGADRALWLTSELFTMSPLKGEWNQLIVGTKTKRLMTIRFKAHRDFQTPKSIHLNMKGGRLKISFSQEEMSSDAYPETDAERAERLRMLPREELLTAACGCDRGVVTPLQTQTESFRIADQQLRRIRRLERRRARLQKKLARQEKGSASWKKTKRRISRTHDYGSNVRENFAHQTSHRLTTAAGILLIAFEDLRILNMTAAPKPKYDEKGNPLHNGRAQKAGLNHAILSSVWGKTLQYTKYKALKCGRLVLVVPPQYTSQTCPKCGHCSKENRPEQALFACTNPDCRFNEDHKLSADQVAACNIAARAVDMLLAGEITFPKRKSILRMRQKGGSRRTKQGREGIARTAKAAPEGAQAAKPVESMANGQAAVSQTVKQEAPSNFSSC